MFPFQQLVQRCRAARHQCSSQHGVQQQQQIDRPTKTHIKPDQSRQQDQESQPRLEEIGNDGEPCFFNNGVLRPMAELSLSFHYYVDHLTPVAARLSGTNSDVSDSAAARFAARTGIKSRNDTMVNSRSRN